MGVVVAVGTALMWGTFESFEPSNLIIVTYLIVTIYRQKICQCEWEICRIVTTNQNQKSFCPILFKFDRGPRGWQGSRQSRPWNIPSRTIILFRRLFSFFFLIPNDLYGIRNDAWLFEPGYCRFGKRLYFMIILLYYFFTWSDPAGLFTVLCQDLAN